MFICCSSAASGRAPSHSQDPTRNLQMSFWKNAYPSFIINECLEHERESIKAYYVLLRNVESESIMLEEFARSQIAAEEMHEAELKKMLRDNF